jgi:hypothetical protein
MQPVTQAKLVENHGKITAISICTEKSVVEAAMIWIVQLWLHVMHVAWKPLQKTSNQFHSTSK